MRYSFIGKKSGKQFAYANETDALIDFKKMFGADLNWIILRSLVGMCVTDFTFENDNFILKGETDD